MRRQIRDCLCGVAVLGMLALVFFWRYIFLSDIIIPWDTATTFYSFQHFVSDSLAKGTFPLWNPYNYAGEPWYPVTEAGLFYPLNLLMILVGASYGALSYRSVELAVILHLVLAGIGTYLLLRSWSIGRAGALISAITFMFGGFMISSIVFYDWVLGAAWLPLVLLLSERAFHEAPTLRPAIATGLVLGLIVLTGYTPMILVAGTIVLTSLFFSFLESSQQRSQVFRRASLRLLLIVMIMLGISSVQLIPAIAFMRVSIYTRASSLDYLRTAGTDVGQLATFLLPNFFGIQQGPSGFWGPGQIAFSYNYYGITTILLAIMSLASLHKRRVVRLLIIGILGVLLAYPSLHLDELVFVLMTQFGAAAVLRPPVFRALFALSIACLSGIGVDSLMADQRPAGDGSPRGATRLVLAVGIVVPVILEATNLFLLSGLQLPNVESTRINDISNALNVTSVLFLASSIMLAVGRRLSDPRTPARVRTALTSTRHENLHAHTFKVVLLLLIFLDLYAFGSATGFNATPMNPVTYVSEYNEPGALETDLVRFLKQDQGLFRVDFNLRNDPSMQRQLEADAMIHKIQLLGGTGSASLLDNYVKCRLQFSSLLPYGFSVVNYSSVFLDLFNVKYVVTDAPINTIDPSADPSRYSLVYLNHYMVYENTRNLPRAFLVPEMTFLDQSAVAGTLSSGFFDPRHQIVISKDNRLGEDHGLRELTMTNQFSHEFSADVGVVSYGPNEIMVDTYSGSNAMLFLGEIYYPGWKAYVDGNGVPIYEANMCFRGVAVPSGNHRILFRFEPLVVHIGAAITSFSSVMVMIWLVVNPSTRGRPRKAHSFLQHLFLNSSNVATLLVTRFHRSGKTCDLSRLHHQDSFKTTRR